MHMCYDYVYYSQDKYSIVGPPVMADSSNSSGNKLVLYCYDRTDAYLYGGAGSSVSGVSGSGSSGSGGGHGLPIGGAQV